MTAERCARNDGAHSLLSCLFSVFARSRAQFGDVQVEAPCLLRLPPSGCVLTSALLIRQTGLAQAVLSDAGNARRGLRRRQRVVEHAMACFVHPQSSRPCSGTRFTWLCAHNRYRERIYDAHYEARQERLYTPPLNLRLREKRATTSLRSRAVPAAPLARCTRNCSNVAAR